MKKKGVGIHQLGRSMFVLGITLMLCGEASAFDGEMSLEKLRSMRYSGPVLELENLSPATQIDLAAPKDSELYSTAYRNKEGCVIFFAAMDKNSHDMTFSWRGPACNGKPVSGPGELQVQYKVDTTKGPRIYVRVFEGNFSAGLLTGQGKKVNLHFDAQGMLLEDTYEFIGQFAYGLLDGHGTKVWYGPSSSQPSVKVISGNFKKGDTDLARCGRTPC